ncbi:MAG: DUF692 family protein [Legionellales bacterium]|nr:DUF692 family protein [Legionellales bacterium]
MDYLGFGVGLRAPHYSYILQHWPTMDWFEILSENYLIKGGHALYALDQIKERYPLVMHGVSLSIGSADSLDMDYLAQLKQLAQRVQPHWISDHLCWTGVQGHASHDLLPLPFTQEALDHVVNRVQQVQAYLDRQIVLENVSTYLEFSQAQMSEWEFLTQVACRADCRILLDINNVYVNAFNHGFDAEQYLAAIPVDRVQQFHLAGHLNQHTHIIDTHNQTVIEPVWDLYRLAVQRFGRVSTLIEWDAEIPEWDILSAQAKKAQVIAERVWANLDQH